MATQVFYFGIIARFCPEPKDGTEEKIKEILTDLNVDDYVFQLERGTELGKFHYQCWVHTKDKIRPETLRKTLPLDVENLTSWGCQPASNNGKQQLRTYCMKKETRVAGPWGFRTIYTGADLACMSTPYPWQQDLIDMIAAPPNDRTIIWIHNPAGDVGKSKLMKWCKYNNLCRRIPLGTATQIKSSVITQGPHRCYMLDLPRVRGKEEKLRELFSAIEEIKNGWVESAMYGKHEEMMMIPPHVIVFSNDAPDLRMASSDRWRIYEVLTRLDSLSQVSQSIYIPRSDDTARAPIEVPGA